MSALLLMTLSACPRGDKPTPPSKEKVIAKGKAAGSVTYSNGKPLSGANITLVSTEYAAGIDGQSKADGTYEISIGNQQSNYRISAWLDKEFNGQTFRFPLEPRSKVTSFFGEKGIVMDFVWKVSGRGWWSSDDQDARSFIGFSVQVGGYDPHNDPGATKPLEAPPGSRVELTFTPKGTLIDGSQGKAVPRSIDLPEGIKKYSGTIGSVFDLPVGNYTVDAVLLDPGGGSKDLRLAYTCNRSPPVCDSRATAFAPVADLTIRPDASVVHSRPYQGPPVAEVKLYVMV